MKNTNKLIILLMNLLILFTLSACSTSSTITDNGTIDATINITWDNDKESIVVSTITIKCNDNYYGVVVNDSINFNNDNNYFTTGNGLLIQITDNEDTLVSNDSIFSYKATIENDVSLYVSGNDEDKVKEVFNNVFKTNKESYQMFSHDISNDWTNNVVITSDVVSFSNGTDTTYIYQNEGSLSPGSFEGKVEPTVFKKQLRGIDIPITYPEDIYGVSNYVPYGVNEYNHWTNEGYTPYSAYDITMVDVYYEDYVQPVTNKEMTREVINKDYDRDVNYIILANNDENVINLFEDMNEHTQNLYSLIPTNKSIESTLKTNEENLSSIREIASSVVNSDNRYHFGVLREKDTYTYQWTESNKDGYYVDGNTYSNLKIAGEMYGKLVIPTMKLSAPAYLAVQGKDIPDTLAKYATLQNTNNLINNGGSGIFDYTYAIETFELANGAFRFGAHGTSTINAEFLEKDITGVENTSFHYNYSIYEGDYLYFYTYYGTLYIYQNISTELVGGISEDKDYSSKQFAQDYTQYPGLAIYREKEDIYSETESCFGDDYNNLSQFYLEVSKIKY